jgi:hypothetical protein
MPSAPYNLGASAGRMRMGSHKTDRLGPKGQWPKGTIAGKAAGLASGKLREPLRTQDWYAEL